jgi:hypothetical protein
MFQTEQPLIALCHLKQPQLEDWGFGYSTFIAAPSAVSDRYRMEGRHSS